MSALEQKKLPVAMEENAVAMVEEALPVLCCLQAAIEAAKEADEPLASACYRPDVLDTLEELAAYFKVRAKAADKRIEAA